MGEVSMYYVARCKICNNKFSIDLSEGYDKVNCTVCPQCIEKNNQNLKK